MNNCCKHLCHLLTKQLNVRDIKLDQWNVILGQARDTLTLGTLTARIRQSSQLDDVPEAVRWHLESAAAISEKYRRDLQWEIEQLTSIFNALDVNLVLLKGAAYVMSGDDLGEGRVFSDIDLLVPYDQIHRVEEGLKWKLWISEHHSKYDQRYYRKWMHEIPPLRHSKRQTVLDIHHTILPLTANLKPDASLLIDSIAPIQGQNELYSLSPFDMILHSATHLFWDSEFNHAFRDLVDFEGLLQLYCDTDKEWEYLINRSIELDLAAPLYYGLHCSSTLFNTKIPSEILEFLSLHWSPVFDKTMLKIFLNSIIPSHPSCKKKITRFNRQLLFIRGHYLRMPAYLLVPHLAYKGLIAPALSILEKEELKN